VKHHPDARHGDRIGIENPTGDVNGLGIQRDGEDEKGGNGGIGGKGRPNETR
jgi:hypothetical protein